MRSRLGFHLLRLRERLWTKPLLYCLLAIAAVFLAQGADLLDGPALPVRVDAETIEKLLTVISSTMLAVATFAVASMLSAYGNAGRAATPRAVALVIADDGSKTALSSFVGAFIFAIVAIVALRTGLYQQNGLLALFALTIAIFGWVILTFVRWTDGIARLGQVGNTVARTEAAAARALERHRTQPHLGAAPLAEDTPELPVALFSTRIGYLQFIDLPALQSVAQDAGLTVQLPCLPGDFIGAQTPLARLSVEGDALDARVLRRLRAAFVIGDDRTFDADARFGVAVLAEIAARALSPAVNDYGTAIVVIGALERLLCTHAEPPPDAAAPPLYDLVALRPLPLAQVLTDSIGPIARAGASDPDVMERLLLALVAMAASGHAALAEQARRHAALALDRAAAADLLPGDLSRLRAAAAPLLARGDASA
jgi:uncharacterized membrane protein